MTIAFGNIYYLIEVNPTKYIWGPNRPKSGPKYVFLLLFCQVWFISSPSNCIDDGLKQCLTTSRGKTHKKFQEAQHQVFCHFLMFAPLVIENRLNTQDLITQNVKKQPKFLQLLDIKSCKYNKQDISTVCYLRRKKLRQKLLSM